jgi:GNAT superfamily N-acetyltransferase
MANHEIRRGRRADARIVRKVLASILREHGLTAVENADPEVARFGESDPSRDDFVAVAGGQVVGFVIVVPLGEGAGELSHVFVERAHRGRGVGTMLITRALEAARTRRYVSVHLATMKAFADACSYYERHGWLRERTDGAGSIFFTRHLEVPRVLPPIPRPLHGILSLLDRFARLRERLERELATARTGPSPRDNRQQRSG